MKIASSCPLRFRKERGALIDLTSSYSVLLCIKLSLLQLPGWSLARMSASSSTKRRSAQHLFMEFYSPPRVCIPLRREGFRAFYSFDLDTGYDFTDFGSRARAWKLLIRYRPFFTMLSAPCTMFSTMMNANFGKMSPEIKAKRFSEAECHLAYSMNVATHQIREERFFCP